MYCFHFSLSDDFIVLDSKLTAGLAFHLLFQTSIAERYWSISAFWDKKEQRDFLAEVKVSNKQ